MKYDIGEVEHNLIGAYIENEDLFSKCEHLVAESLFSNKTNRLVFKVIKSLRSKGIKPDLVTITREIKASFVNAKVPAYSAESNYKFQPEQYVIFLFEENRIKKHLMPSLHSAYNQFNSSMGSPLDIMSELKGKINDVEMVLNNVSAEKSIGEIVDKAIEEVLESSDARASSAPSTSLRGLDAITGGLLPGVFVLGALPGMGKTSFIVNVMVHNAIKLKVPVVFFSLEMSATQIVKNIVANVHEINTMAIRDGALDEEEKIRFKSIKPMFKDHLIIDDTPGVTWQYIDAKLTKIRKKFPIGQQIIVMVDYLQLMSNTEDEIKGKTDEAQMALRCKGLMNMWKKHNACIIELTQLGREVAKGERRPKMSDAKDSGAIEANANVFALLHCPDYFDPKARSSNGTSLAGLMEIIVNKNRGGRTGFAYAKFIKKYSKILDSDKSEWEGDEGKGII